MLIPCVAARGTAEERSSMNLTEIQRIAWQTAEDKGHHENLASLGTREATLVRLALIHTELSEAAQIVKRHGVGGREAELAEELADTIIRIADLAQELHLDLDLAVWLKLETNKHRPMYYGTPDECPSNSQ